MQDYKVVGLQIILIPRSEFLQYNFAAIFLTSRMSVDLFRNDEQ